MMAEEFEGPVVVKRPAGQPPDFEVAKFDGDVSLDGTVRTTHVSGAGNISARGNVNGGNVNAGEAVIAKRIELSDHLPAPPGGPTGPDSGGAGTSEEVRSVLKVQARDTLTLMHLRAEGNISALGNVNAGETVNTQHVSAQGNISALGNVNAGAHVSAQGNISAQNNVNAKNMNVSETVNTQHVSAQGNISAQNNVNAKNMNVEEDIFIANSDCAEEFDVEDSSPGEPLPGSVMVIGDEGSVRLSTSAYDKRVAGIISGAGTFKPGIILDRQNSDSSRPAVALMGKVFCKVDTTNGPIEVGDLLTTSSTLGHAMKAADPFKAFGAVLGKALRPLKEGQGLIPVLVALQ
jgi:hypothetical protein